jgi:hypothetical protein
MRPDRKRCDECRMPASRRRRRERERAESESVTPEELHRLVDYACHLVGQRQIGGLEALVVVTDVLLAAGGNLGLRVVLKRMADERS